MQPHGFFNCSPAVDVPPSACELDSKDADAKENGVAKQIQAPIMSKLWTGLTAPFLAFITYRLQISSLLWFLSQVGCFLLLLVYIEAAQLFTFWSLRWNNFSSFLNTLTLSMCIWWSYLHGSVFLKKFKLLFDHRHLLLSWILYILLFA